MISVFGVISAVAAAVSVAALVLHFKLMQRRTAVDEALAAANELLYFYEDPDEADEEIPDVSREEAAAAVTAYNDAALAYNAYISAFPGKIMAAGFVRLFIFACTKGVKSLFNRLAASRGDASQMPAIQSLALAKRVTVS